MRQDCSSSADWLFDCALMQLGFASVAALPALARNIDCDTASTLGLRPITEAQPAVGLDPGLFRIYQRNLYAATQTVDAVGYCFDPRFDRFIVFPHQLAPQAYVGAWRVKWHQCFGPFAMQPTNAGDTVRWELARGSCDVILRTADANKRFRVIAEGSVNEFAHPGGSYSVSFERSGGGSIPLELQPDPGVAVSAILFSEPQPWFRGLENWRHRMEGLGLIKHLPIETDAPSIAGGFDNSLPDLIDHER